MPEVLSSIEADETIRNYAEAINNFLSGFNQCRGVVASRQFRGPKHLGWPQFRILPLESRRLELIRKAELEPRIERELIGQLRIASQEIQDVTKNPMFLGILCEDLRDGSPFPKNTHSVFESYLEKRLARDKERLKKRFDLEPSEVRTAAEKVAFCMSIDPGLGLSPTREGIRSAMGRYGFKIPRYFEQFLNALEYLKLARSETETIPGKSQIFTFAHRRFQEYFATCVVLHEPHLIGSRQLLTDGRWRETVVVIFQTQPPEVLAPILAEVQHLLDELLGSLSGLIDAPVGYVDREIASKNRSIPKPFSWPPGVLHLLGLLQDGFINRTQDLPDNIQTQAGRFLLSASSKGTLSDQKWSLEVAGIAPQAVLLWLLRHAFTSESQWIKEVAYRQTARLGKIPDDIAADIRKALLSLFIRNRLHRERFATHAHLSRLDQAAQYINVMRLLQWITPIDIILHIVLFLILLWWLLVVYKASLLPLVLSAIVLATFLLYSYFRLRFFSYKVSSTRVTLDQETSSVNSMQVLGVDVLLVYLRLLFFPLLWSVFAILAVNTGQFTHPFWWPLLLLFPAVYLIVKFRKFIKICTFLLKNIQTYIFIFSTLFLLKIKDFIVLHDNTDNLKNIIGAIYTVFLLFLLPKMFQSSSYWLRDWIQWQKWIRSCPSLLTAQDLLNLIKLYHYTVFCKRLTTVIRERNLLTVTEETEELINELALALERSLVFKKRKANKIQKIRQKERQNFLKYLVYVIKLLPKGFKLSRKSSKTRNKRRVSNYSGSEFFNFWLKQYTLKDKTRLVKLGSEFLDEIYILLEQVRARRQVSENSK